jgi:hypothetical protein
MEEIMISMLSEKYVRISKQLRIVNKAITDSIDIEVLATTQQFLRSRLKEYRQCLIVQRRALHAALNEIHH